MTAQDSVSDSPQELSGQALPASDGYAFICPGCGGETDSLIEGYCEHCFKANQDYLDEHNAAYYRWRTMDEWKRNLEIKDGENPQVLRRASQVRQRLVRRDLWNKCDVCGRIISYVDFEKGKAIHTMKTPDSDVSYETWETLCRDHYKPNRNDQLLAPGKPDSGTKDHDENTKTNT